MDSSYVLALPVLGRANTIRRYMPHAHPEYAIALSLLGILLAIGIPSLKRGQFIVGGVCLGAAVAVVGWSIVAVIRARKG